MSLAVLRCDSRFPEWAPAFFELPGFLRLSADTWVEDLRAAMERYGFSEIRVEYLSFGTAAMVNGVKD